MKTPGFGKPEDQGWPTTETSSCELYALSGSENEETRVLRKELQAH